MAPHSENSSLLRQSEISSTMIVSSIKCENINFLLGHFPGVIQTPSLSLTKPSLQKQPTLQTAGQITPARLGLSQVRSPHPDPQSL